MQIKLPSACLTLFVFFGVRMAMCQSRDNEEYKSRKLYTNGSLPREDAKGFGIRMPERCGYIQVLKVRNADPKISKPMQAVGPMPILEGLRPCSQLSEPKTLLRKPGSPSE